MFLVIICPDLFETHRILKKIMQKILMRPGNEATFLTENVTALNKCIIYFIAFTYLSAIVIKNKKDRILLINEKDTSEEDLAHP